MMNRIMGVLTLKAPVYREIADDPSATNQALIIVIIVALIAGVSGFVAASVANSALAQLGAQAGGVTVPTISPPGQGLSGILSALVGWVVGAFALDFTARQFFKGRSTFQQMLRVTGYTSVFGIVGSVLALIPCVGALAALIAVVLQVIGNIIGIREAAGLDNTKAILTAIIAGVLVFIVAAVIGVVLGLIFQ